MDWSGVVGGGAGNDVPVGVGDFLTGRRAVVDGNGSGGGVCCGFDGGEYVMDGVHEVFGAVGWEVVEAFVVVGGNDEGVTWSEWVCVKERVGGVSFVDGAAGSLIVSDLTKHTRHSR